LIAQIDLAAIRFRTNSSELDADSVNILDQVADALQQVPSATVEIEGHTDSTGNNERNIVLSGERADRVRSFLINRGIGGDRLTTRGYGSSQPIASNDTVTGRALNRRIELVLTNGEKYERHGRVSFHHRPYCISRRHHRLVPAEFFLTQCR